MSTSALTCIFSPGLAARTFLPAHVRWRTTAFFRSLKGNTLASMIVHTGCNSPDWLEFFLCRTFFGGPRRSHRYISRINGLCAERVVAILNLYRVCVCVSTCARTHLREHPFIRAHLHNILIHVAIVAGCGWQNN